MAGNPLSDPNWASDVADTIDRVVGTVRDRAITPVVHVTRGIVFGVLAAFLGITAVILALVGTTRALQALLELAVSDAQAVYSSYLILGGILCLAGAFALWKRHSPDV